MSVHKLLLFFLEMFYFQFNNFHAFLHSIFMKFIVYREKNSAFPWCKKLRHGVKTISIEIIPKTTAIFGASRNY